MLKKKINILSLSPVFKGCSQETIESLSTIALLRTYERNAAVFTQIQSGSALHLVASGKVKLSMESFEGREQTVFIFEKGEPFCLCRAFCGETPHMGAIAIEKSEIISIPEIDLLGRAEQEPLIMMNMLKLMSMRFRSAIELVESLAFKEIPQRLASFLSLQTSKNNCQPLCELQLPFSQRELAKMLGATPETLSRVLKKMGEQGLIASKGRAVTVIELGRLEKIANGSISL